MDCSCGDSQLLAKAQELPSELIQAIRRSTNEEYLASLAKAALDPKFTDTIFVSHAPLFPEFCSRYCSSDNYGLIVPVFGRILPFAPHLSAYAETFLKRQLGLGVSLGSFYRRNWTDKAVCHIRLSEVLLGIFRLLVFKSTVFRQFVQPGDLLPLLQHSDISIRYLTTRILALWTSASDKALGKGISEWCGDDDVRGYWETKAIDYRFLSLWEEKRLGHVDKLLRDAQALQHAQGCLRSQPGRMICKRDLSPLATEICGILIPRVRPCQNPISLSNGDIIDPVLTPSTMMNLKKLAGSIMQSDALLITGPAGCGKTMSVNYMAHESNQLSSMITLHINEQTDAKLLIGTYTTGKIPGSFVWTAGVLTRAVKEGRWVLIEDLDRAPNAVISILLPLMERRDLLIPGRNELVSAAQGFKMIATMRTRVNVHAQEYLPVTNMLGMRLWTQVRMQMPIEEELQAIISTRYPSLEALGPRLLAVYATIEPLSRDALQMRSRNSNGRPLTLHDLLKWCARLDALLSTSGLSNNFEDDMFLEAIDCLTGYMVGQATRDTVAARIAQELHLEPQRAAYLQGDRHIRYGLVGKAGEDALQIGRSTLPRYKAASRGHASSKDESGTFAITPYALRILEKVSVAIASKEPLLVVGETGVGKTSSIQHLAKTLGHNLVVVNLSQQSESGDLLGGFKPVNVRSLVTPLHDEFTFLFNKTFSRKKNQHFHERLGKYLAKGQWRRVCTMWNEALRMLENTFGASGIAQALSAAYSDQHLHKKRKVDPASRLFDEDRWMRFAARLKDLQAHLSSAAESFAFTFTESNVIKAVRNGDWILLDEINLASSDTLECLSDLLRSGSDGAPSIMLTESGNVDRIEAHRDFRIFAAMNPATDVGKKDLPMGIRSRFTEFFIDGPDQDVKSLRSIINSHLGNLASSDPSIIKDIAATYLEIKRLTEANVLVDGANEMPHFSLRSLTRALTYVRQASSLCSLRRACCDGFRMSFSTLLDQPSERRVMQVIDKHIWRNHPNQRAELTKNIRNPDERYFVSVQIASVMEDAVLASSLKAKGRLHDTAETCWIPRGNQGIAERPDYIITPFVQRNLANLARAIFTKKFPILVQGPTSSGKTSMIEYLANISGNKFVRINNHEHTDLQEYLGSYISDSEGRLRFREGVLVHALREGHWVVLDELNLAPTDVLEALNRLLDDNRELLIPETQEVVRPHPNFVLFATQNPSGLYGGRKVLSRAFRNRFLELHFDDIPVPELEVILQNRSNIPNSWCHRIVKVYERLSVLRQENRLFEQRSFATLRDLFRWSSRGADTLEQLATNGFMLLGERVRKQDERQAVRAVIEEIMSEKGPNIRIDEASLYSVQSHEIRLGMRLINPGRLTWTRSIRRLFVLVYRALQRNEPVLLIGETGCGKTTICQALADAAHKTLHTVNAHQNTEIGDLIGAQRPVRKRALVEKRLYQDLAGALETMSPADANQEDLQSLLRLFDQLCVIDPTKFSADLRARIRTNRTMLNALFQWSDGSLVHAMKTGQYFLLDEISLADDSVLERLNSVLEPKRTLLLAEKGPEDSLVVAADGFQFLATMNPGGDYGKRELSPALRNRFTEIWVPPLSDDEDVYDIVASQFDGTMSKYAGAMVSFARWFCSTYNASASSSISIRDTLAWVEFVNVFKHPSLMSRLVHGAAMIYIDTIGATAAAMLAFPSQQIYCERQKCLEKLSENLGKDISAFYPGDARVHADDLSFSVGAFSIQRTGRGGDESWPFFEAPTTKLNAMRVMRALQLPKPILLEGNPGVGKTSLVVALAEASGRPLTRINLSDQTDLMDLFGADVPVEGGLIGDFAWRDGSFLTAMKNGHWVLLDEMNLAPQAVLEGLNACLDHRGEVYVAELDQTFRRHPQFRIFGAQNPHHQGGGRKGLPASFVNRFTVVFADTFSAVDLMLICKRARPNASEELVSKLVKFVTALDQQVVQDRSFGSSGGPWEFNLRDILRWLDLLTSGEGLLPAGEAHDFAETIFTQRFRTPIDRERLHELIAQIFGTRDVDRSSYHNISSHAVQVGLGLLPRADLLQDFVDAAASESFVQPLPVMESLLICAQKNWPVILAGPSGCGKTSLLRRLAAIVGASLIEFPINADIDGLDLLGGYDQVDPSRKINAFLRRCDSLIRRVLVEHCIERTAASSELLERIEGWQITTLGNNDLSELHVLLTSILKITAFAEAQKLLDECWLLMSMPNTVERAEFEWIDGVLVQAIEQGSWLVLDNANLCSSSTLDRLNSLVEPNGYLVVNEHCSAQGHAKVVKPHPNFRIFMTMDPRHGELSRAMRNRAVELYIMPHDSQPKAKSVHISCALALDSSMYRFRHMMRIENHARHKAPYDMVRDVGLDHLSHADTRLFAAFRDQISLGLVDAEALETALSIHIRQQLSEHFQSDSLYPCVGDTEVAKLRKVQPIHPIVNQPYTVMRSGASASVDAFWLAHAYDMFLDIARMHRSLAQIKAHSVGGEALNRLGKRMDSNLYPAVGEEVTNAVADFLLDVGSAVEAWLLQELGRPAVGEAIIYAVQDALEFWWHFFTLLTRPHFDQAAFRVYLSLAKAKFVKFQVLEPSSARLAARLHGALQTLQITSHLSSGLSMQRLWSIFRPRTVSTYQRLQNLLQLEELADRFDAVIWRVRAPLQDVCRVRASITNALHMVLYDDIEVGDLVMDLHQSLHEIESSAIEGERLTRPYFQYAFESICRYLESRCSITHYLVDQAPLLLLLAGRPTRAATALDAAKHDLDKVMHDSRSSFSFKDTGFPPLAFPPPDFQVSVLSKLNALSDVTLRQLDLLEVECLLLGRSLANGSYTLCSDVALRQAIVLSSLIHRILIAHEDYLDQASLHQVTYALCNASEFKGDWSKLGLLKGLKHRETLPCDHYFKTILGNHIQPLLECLFNTLRGQAIDVNSLATAWLHFALAGLKLYVPDRPVDPALEPFIEREMHKKQKSDLQTRMKALTEFEQMFTARSTNMRYRLLERKLDALGAEPETPAIARPPVSSLEQLQGEFGILLQAIEQLPTALMSGLGEVLDFSEVQNNLHRLMERLSNGFRAYEDITGPVVMLLECLDLGLSLVNQANEGSTILPEPSLFADLIPFLGVKASRLLHRTDVETFKASISARPFPLDQLALFGLVRSIFPSHPLHVSQRDEVLRLFEELYQQWRKYVAAEQKKATINSSIYHYRGWLENETEAADADFHEIFATYEGASDTDGTSSMNSVNDARQLAIKVAQAHEDLLTNDISPPSRLRALLADAASRFSKPPGKDERRTQSKISLQLLPSIMLTLKEKTEVLCTDPRVAGTYNFYTEPNIVEAKRMLLLVRMIRDRTNLIIAAWAEHAILWEVMRISNELLDFRHSEPIAKFLTKGEKLHEAIYEWQRVASKEFSMVSNYEALTSLLVSWRQLELSTWSHLLDKESKNSKCDAKSWWFIAYETMVATPRLLIASGGDIVTHVRKVTATLEAFLSATSIGQFSARIRLLESFDQYLAICVPAEPQLETVRRALNNFVAHFSRYEPYITARLQRGRAEIEQEVKDVIKLASWRDKTISALKHSAKLSHNKLFNSIRKYRKFLAQPVELRTPKNGAASLALRDQPNPSVCLPLAAVSSCVDPEALQVCEELLPAWSGRPTRFTDMSMVLTRMREKAEPDSSSVRGAAYIKSLLSDLSSSVAELRKATPQTVTDDNRSLVKHIKHRKRKLFADILKDLRLMGFKPNLPADVASQQSSLSAVLTTMPTLPRNFGVPAVCIADAYLHGTVELMPKARETLREHSEDLTGSEIIKSVGYLESIIASVLAQRRLLAGLLENLEVLEAITDIIVEVTKTKKDTLLGCTTNLRYENQAVERTIAWLPTILDVGATIVEAHAKLGEVDEAEIVRNLRSWSQRFSNLHQQIQRHPKLPEDMSSQEQQDDYRECQQALRDLQSQASHWTSIYPNLIFVLQQIIPWTTVKVAQANGDINGSGKIEPNTLAKEIFAALDLILGSLQDVQQASLAMPKSTEEVSWLRLEDKTWAARISALHIPHVSKSLTGVLSKIHSCGGQGGQGFTAISALLVAVLPVIQQYCAISKREVQEYATLHEMYCNMSLDLGTLFIHVSQQGFCRPLEPSEVQGEKGDQQVEGGVGLGQGEGAEDISKDVQQDEDLTELAEDAGNGRSEVGIERDAVEMEDMEGELKDDSLEQADGEERSDAGDGEQDIDEETGELDTLGPSTVDEKQWTGDTVDDNLKTEDGRKARGNGDRTGEQLAGEEPGNEKENGVSEDSVASETDHENGGDQGEEQALEDIGAADPHVDAGDTLDLPDDLDMNHSKQEEVDIDTDTSGEEFGSEDEPMYDAMGLPEDEVEERVDSIGGATELEDQVPDTDTRSPERNALAENESAYPNQGSEPTGDDQAGCNHDGKVGYAMDSSLDDVNNNADEEQEAHTNREPLDSRAASASEGFDGEGRNQERIGNRASQYLPEHVQRESVRRLGDQLEEWYRQMRHIQEASQSGENKPSMTEDDMAHATFEHMPDEGAGADTQALGAASADQARALDESSALHSNDVDNSEGFLPDVDEVTEARGENAGGVEPTQQPPELLEGPIQHPRQASSGFAQFSQPLRPALDNPSMTEEQPIHEDEDTLSAVRMETTSTSSTRSLEESRSLWLHHENATRNLSLTLTEQLRLILAPTLASRMRGDFRTGKRLNIKRIIPYIASQYKRDKIWMRRSVPSKRDYQIMLAIDDSKSMLESGSVELALETLALVSKSMSMLEVGELCIVGFGQEVHVAHDFSTPFTSDAGVNVVRQFGFQQAQTNVRRLVADSISIFRTARERASASGADLWQLQFIISDAICEDHDTIVRLVRQAQSERIMIVFIVIDAANGQSIMDLNTADFVQDQDGKLEVRKRRYLDTFPFRYYLVVRHVTELPGVLATALRQWFAEVVEAEQR